MRYLFWMLIMLGMGGVHAEIFSSKDAGKTWQAAGLAGKPVDELVPDPKDPLTLYALLGTNVLNRKEAWRTADGGKTWEKLGIPFEPNCLTVSTDAPKTLGAGGREGAYALSKDGGKTWIQASLGEIVKGDFGLMHVRGLGIAGLSIYAVGGNGHGFMVASFDGGKTWKPGSAKNLEYAWAFAMAKHAHLIGGDSGLLISEDQGKTYFNKNTIPEKLGTGGRFSLSPDGQNVVFSFRGDVAASRDGGKTWSAMSGPEKEKFVHAVAWVDGQTVALAQHGKRISDGPMTFFQSDGGATLYVSKDGAKWEALTAPDGQTPAVVTQNSDGKVLWLGAHAKNDGAKK